MNSHHYSGPAHKISMLLALLLALILPGMAHSQVVGNGYNNSLISLVSG